MIIIIIYTLFGINAPKGANKTLSTLISILIYLALPRITCTSLSACLAICLCL